MFTLKEQQIINDFEELSNQQKEQHHIYFIKDDKNEITLLKFIELFNNCSTNQLNNSSIMDLIKQNYLKFNQELIFKKILEKQHDPLLKEIDKDNSFKLQILNKLISRILNEFHFQNKTSWLNEQKYDEFMNLFIK